MRIPQCYSFWGVRNSYAQLIRVTHSECWKIMDTVLWSNGIVNRLDTGNSNEKQPPVMAVTNLDIVTYNLHGIRRDLPF